MLELWVRKYLQFYAEIFCLFMSVIEVKLEIGFPSIFHVNYLINQYMDTSFKGYILCSAFAYLKLNLQVTKLSNLVFWRDCEAVEVFTTIHGGSIWVVIFY